MMKNIIIVKESGNYVVQECCDNTHCGLDCDCRELYFGKFNWLAIAIARKQARKLSVPVNFVD